MTTTENRTLKHLLQKGIQKISFIERKETIYCTQLLRHQVEEYFLCGLLFCLDAHSLWWFVLSRRCLEKCRRDVKLFSGHQPGHSHFGRGFVAPKSCRSTAPNCGTCRPPWLKQKLSGAEYKHVIVGGKLKCAIRVRCVWAHCNIVWRHEQKTLVHGMKITGTDLGFLVVHCRKQA